MIRTLRLLGMSLVVALSFAAFAASASALSGTYGAEAYPVTIGGSTTEATRVTYGAGVNWWSCASESIATSVASKGQTTASMTPTYTNCSLKGGGTQPAKINLNGCKYNWTISTAGLNQSASGVESASCEAGKQVEFVVYENQAALEKGTAMCAYKLPNTPVSGGLTFSDLGSGSTRHITAARSATYASTVTVGSKAVCGAGAGETLNLSFSGKTDLTGVVGGAQKGIAISAGDLSVEGEASEIAENQPHFTGSWPEGGSELHSESSQLHKFTVGGINRTIECGSVSYVGTKFGQKVYNKKLSIAPSFGACTSNGVVPATVVPCAPSYQELTLDNAGPPYVATLKTCPYTINVYENQKQLEADVPMCKYSLPAQSIAGFGVSNVSNGIFGGVNLTWSATKLSYSVLVGSKALCGNPESYSLSYSGGVTMYAN